MEIEVANPLNRVVVAAPETEEDHKPDGYGPLRDTVLKLEGHGAAVNGLAWHPVEPLLASASFDKTVYLWQTSDPGCPAVSVLRGHTSSVTGVSFIGNGGVLTTSSADKTLAVYDAVTGDRLKILRGHTSHVNSVRGRDVHGGSDDVFLTGNPAEPYLILSGANDCSARVWDSRNWRRGSEIVLAHDYQVLDALFGEDQHIIYSSGIDPRIYTWDARKPDTPVEFMNGHTDIVTGLAISTLHSHVATHSADGRVGIWDVRPFIGESGHGSRLERFLGGCSHGFEQNLMRPGWDLGGARVAAGTADGVVHVWDADDGELICSLGGHQGAVTDVSFSPVVDTLLASASLDNTILLGHIPSSFS